MRRPPAIKANKFILSGDSVFHTLQGEGSNVGTQATFIRLHYCNLACNFCDTPYTWNPKLPEYSNEPTEVDFLELADIILEAKKAKGLKSKFLNFGKLVFTGGEPLLQQASIGSFLSSPAGINYSAEIETNGTIEPDELLSMLITSRRVMLNISPKLSNSGNPLRPTNSIKAYSPFSIYKFVVKDVSDLEEINKFVSDHYLDKEKVYIMPEGQNSEECSKTLNKELVYTCLAEGYNITPRFQHDLFKGETRAV